jgi:MoaD family protein
MKIKINFFAYFRELFRGREREFELKDGATVQELLGILCDSPELRSEIFESNKLKPYLIIVKNGVSIYSLEHLSTGLEEGDIISVFPLMGGG